MDARSPDPNEQEFGGGEPERKDRGQGGRRLKDVEAIFSRCANALQSKMTFR